MFQTKKQAAVKEVTFAVKKGNIRSTISGTAQLEPQEQQNIVPPKEGMIKTINLTKNQQVKKGDLLLELTDSELEVKLDSAEITLSQQQADMKDLQTQLASQRMVVPVSGKLIMGTNIAEGSSVSKTTKIATIADPNSLSVTLPFLQEESSQVQTGDRVQLTIEGFMLTKSGTVESVKPAAAPDAKGNRLNSIVVRIDNDGTMDADLKVKGYIVNGGLKVESQADAAIQYKTTTSVLAGVSGTIDKLGIKENQMVTAGQLIGTITNDTLQKDITNKQQQIDQSQRTIDNLKDQLEKLKVYAPFDGVFSTDFADQKKNVLASYTVGTTINNGVQLGAVASLDTLQLPIKIDELDLPKIKAGLKAEVKVDAVPGKVFTGEVTQVSTVGTVTNGVTSYTAVVTLKNASELKYSMTATADILIQDKKDVLVVPVEAVKTRNGKKVVTLKNADGTNVADHEVKVGANSSTMIEITDGLKEGDTLVVSTSGSSGKLSTQDANQLRNQFQQQGGRTTAPAGGGGFPGGGGGGGFRGPGGG
jgi:HlyD family secretion protein